MAEIDRALTDADLAESTYVIFTSDNGYMHGEHRIRSGKLQPYEEAIRVPLLIRGPGVPRGVRIGDPVADVDLAPTIAELTAAGQAPGLERSADGGSLVAHLAGQRDPGRAILIEAKRPARATPSGAVARSFIGVRTRRYAYVERYELRTTTVEEGFDAALGAGDLVDRELYDLRRDPYQLESRHASGRYAATRATLAATLLGCGSGGLRLPARRRGAGARRGADGLKPTPGAPDTGADVRHRRSAAHPGRARGLRSARQGSGLAADPCPRRARAPLPGVEPLESEDTEAALRQILTDPRLLEEFEREGRSTSPTRSPACRGFRVNAFRQRGSVSIACRAIPFQVRTIEDLGLPPAIRRLADEQRGSCSLPVPPARASRRRSRRWSITSTRPGPGT